MNRLTRKCLIGSATLHGSLCGIVLICSAFASKHTETPPPSVIQLIPFGGNFKVTDGLSHGGGAPPPQIVKATPDPTPAPAPPPQARAEKSEPTPPKKEHPVDKTPTPKPPTPKDDGDEPPVRSKTHKVQVNLSPVVHTTKPSKTKTKSHADQSEADSAAENKSRLRNRLAQNIAGIADSIARSTAQSVVSDSFGDNTGGIASVNYNTVLFTRYYNAWISPDDSQDSESTADARVTIAHDGTVISATLEKRSGNAAMDRSIERALKAVRKLEAFPSAWKESEKTFRIRFNLKSKLGIG